MVNIFLLVVKVDRGVKIYDFKNYHKRSNDFHVLGLFMARKHNKSEKKIPSVTRRWTQNLCHAYSLDHKT
jgi:hypothetical protein